MIMVSLQSLWSGSTFDNHWFPKKLWFLQKVTSWSEKNGKKPIFHHFGRPKITTFWPRIFLMKFLFPANKTAFTTKFSPCPVILSSFWAVFRFVHRAMAIYWRHFFNLVFGAKIRPKCILGNKWCHRQRHALLPNLHIFIKSNASTKFCQNFNLVVFFNRLNFEKMYWQVREIAYAQAVKTTSFGAILNSHTQTYNRKFA